MGSVEGQPNSARTPRRRATSNRNRTAAALLVAGVMVSAAGCSSHGGSQAAVSGTSSSAVVSTDLASNAASSSASASGATDLTGPVGQAGLATYDAMWKDVVAVEATMDYHNPQLVDHLSGQALSYYEKSIYLNHQNGTVAVGEPKLLHPAVSRIVGSGDAAQVVVDDCADLSSWRLHTTDGTPAGTDAGGRHKVEVLVLRSGGVWKVDQFAFSAEGTC